MEKYVINGGKPLQGEVRYKRSEKIAAVAIIPAALMVDGVCRIENMPQISDTDMLLTILTQLGAEVRVICPGTIEIDSRNVRFCDAPFELMRKIRASYYLIGAMLGRFGSAKDSYARRLQLRRPPDRPAYQGHERPRRDSRCTQRICVCRGGRRQACTAAPVYLDKVSVGATMNIILAATMANGRTIIENAAREPHIVDLANFLNSMGADIRGAGTDTVKINGVERLHGGSYSIIPDQIEAGTYMAAAAATLAGEVLVKNVIPDESTLSAFRQSCARRARSSRSMRTASS